jgi:hypothetical protein
MRQKALVTTAGAALASLTLLAAHEKIALARTVHATAGTPISGFSPADWNAANNVISRTGALSTWIIPLVFDNAGARNFTVRGKVVSGELRCRAVAINPDGSLASVSADTVFPVTGSFTAISLTLTSIPFGAQGNLSCTFSGGGNQQLLGIDYPP